MNIKMSDLPSYKVLIGYPVITEQSNSKYFYSLFIHSSCQLFQESSRMTPSSQKNKNVTVNPPILKNLPRTKKR